MTSKLRSHAFAVTTEFCRFLGQNSCELGG